MKKHLEIYPTYYILSVMFVSLILFGSCEENSETTETEQYVGQSGIYYASLYGPYNNQDGAKSIEIWFSDSTGDSTFPELYYYFLIFLDSVDTIEVTYSGEYSPFENEIINCDFDSVDVPAGDYDVLIYACSFNSFSFGSIDHYAFIDRITVYWDDSDPCTNVGRQYAGAYKTESGIIGARAHIKARYGLLCDELNFASDTALSAAWIGVACEPVPYDVYHAQIGYAKYRNPYYMPYIRFQYAELGYPGDSSVLIAVFDVPNEGSEDNYEVFLDQVTGTWTFEINDQFFYDLADTFWQANTGQWVEWSGEIINIEDDMPGTEFDPCIMSFCTYNNGLGWHGGFKPPYNYHISDPAEWNAEVVLDTSTLHIWDKNPQ